MKLTARENLGLPDAGIVNDPRTREIVARVIRRFKPRVVIAPARQGRHPDHRVTSELVRDACFVAGLAKLAPDVARSVQAAAQPLAAEHSLDLDQDLGVASRPR